MREKVFYIVLFCVCFLYETTSVNASDASCVRNINFTSGAKNWTLYYVPKYEFDQDILINKRNYPGKEELFNKKVAGRWITMKEA